MTAKECTKCGQTKPVSDFYAKMDGSGPRSWCKVCHNPKKTSRRCFTCNTVRPVARFAYSKKMCDSCRNDTGRRCYKCKKFKPYAEFFRRDYTYCKACSNEQIRVRRLTKPKRCRRCGVYWSRGSFDDGARHCKTCTAARMTEPKACKVCKQTKPASEFYVLKKNYLWPYCKPCMSAKVRAWQKANS